MGQNEKGVIELAPVASAERASASWSPGSSNGSPQEDNAFLHKQTRTRRLFNEKQLFAFSLVYMGTWSGVPA